MATLASVWGSSAHAVLVTHTNTATWDVHQIHRNCICIKDESNMRNLLPFKSSPNPLVGKTVQVLRSQGTSYCLKMDGVEIIWIPKHDSAKIGTCFRSIEGLYRI